MPIPRLNMPRYKLTENDRMDNVICQLHKMGYKVNSAKRAIRIIEKFHIDKSQFDFPFGSYDKFKKRVLAGELEMKPLNMMTQEEQEQLDKAVREGELWITY